MSLTFDKERLNNQNINRMKIIWIILSLSLTSSAFKCVFALCFDEYRFLSRKRIKLT